MPTTADLALTPYPSVLIIGDGGTKKTTVASWFPRPYFFDFDAGLAVLRGREGIDYDTFKDAPRDSKVFNPDRGIYEYGTAWPAFIKRLNEIGALIDAQTSPHQTLVFDSLTTLGNIALNHVKASQARLGKYKWTDPVDPGMWGMQSNLMETVVDQLTAWPVTKIMTAHIQRDTNELLQTVEMLPLTTGKWASKVGIYFDEVWFTQVDAGKLVLRTAPDRMLKGKSRFNLPDKTPLEWAAIQKVLFPSQAKAKA